MSLSSKQRAELRAEAHHLSPLVHVGLQGLTDTLVNALDDALRTRELVKVAIGRNSEVEAKPAANELALQLNAGVVQVIGRTFTLYRENADLTRKHGDLPPWKR